MPHVWVYSWFTVWWCHEAAVDHRIFCFIVEKKAPIADENLIQAEMFMDWSFIHDSYCDL